MNRTMVDMRIALQKPLVFYASENIILFILINR